MPGSQAFVAATTVGVHCPTYNQARNISNRQPATCQIVKYQTEKCRGRNKQRNVEGGALCYPCQALCVNSAHHTELAHRMREVHGVRRHCLVHLQRQREITKWDGNGERQREVSKWDGNGSVPSGHQTRSSCAPPTRSAGAASRHCEHNAGAVREIERERVVEWEGQTYLRSVAHARTFLCASQSTSKSER